MKKLFLTISFLILPHLAQAKLNVVTTTEDLASIAQSVGGDLIEVKSLAHGDEDPHFLEPKPSFVVSLNRADLLIDVGLELEIGWLPVLVNQARNNKIMTGNSGRLTASEGLKLLEIPNGKVDRSMGDVHPDGNPHYWLNPQNALIMAQNIASRLSQIDPVHQSDYQARAKVFTETLTQKIKEWNALLAPYKGTKLITYHKSFSYLVDWAGFNVVGFIEPKPGIPPSPAHLIELIDLIKKEGVKLIISENYYDVKSGDELANQTGVPILHLPVSVHGDQNVPDYLSLMNQLVVQIKGAL